MLLATSLLGLFFISDVLSECTKQASLIITVPKKMQGLSESCLEIPCSYNANPPRKLDGRTRTGGVWIKNDSRFEQRKHNVIFNSSEAHSDYPMKLTGNLRERDCTTLFSNLTTAHSNTYFFRLENTGFKATASCHPLQIKVQDSPPRPEIKISGVLHEKEYVNVTCTAVAPCPHFPPRLHWNLNDFQSQTLRGEDMVRQTQIQRTIYLTDKDDGFTVTCVASYPVRGTWKNATQAETLDVSHGPKNTKVSIKPEGLQPAGTLVTLSCSSRAKPPITEFTWFRTNQDGREEKINVSEEPVYSFNLTENGVYRCEASNSLGEESSTIELSIQGQENASSSGAAIVAVVCVVILLLGAVVVFWWFKFRLASSQWRQRQAAAQGSSGTVTTEEIHYGQIDFSKWTPEHTTGQTTNSRGQQCALSAQEPVYAQVKINK